MSTVVVSAKAQTLALVLSAFARFEAATDKREFFITEAEQLFDRYFVPLDLGPADPIVDPLARQAIRPLIGRLYDGTIKLVETACHA